MGSLAGAAHLLNANVGVLRTTQGEGKSRVDQKGKGGLSTFLNKEMWLWKYGLSILYWLGVIMIEVSEKLPQG